MNTNPPPFYPCCALSTCASYFSCPQASLRDPNTWASGLCPWWPFLPVSFFLMSPDLRNNHLFPWLTAGVPSALCLPFLCFNKLVLIFEVLVCLPVNLCEDRTGFFAICSGTVGPDTGRALCKWLMHEWDNGCMDGWMDEWMFGRTQHLSSEWESEWIQAKTF